MSLLLYLDMLILLTVYLNYTLNANIFTSLNLFDYIAPYEFLYIHISHCGVMVSKLVFLGTN